VGKKKVTAKPAETDVAKRSSEDALPAVKEPEGALRHIDLDSLTIVESVARGEDEDIERLCGSLRRHGQLVPAIVRYLGSNKYLVEDGTRRFLALKRLQEKHGERCQLLALVRGRNTTAPAGQLSFEALVANLDRKEFTPLDKVKHAGHLLETLESFTGQRGQQRQIAALMGVRESTLSGWLSVFRTPETRGLVEKEGLPLCAGRSIASIKDPGERRSFVERLLGEKKASECFPAVRVIARAARHPALRDAILDGVMTFADVRATTGRNGVQSRDDIDCLVEEIRSRRGSEDGRMSEDELAEFASTVKNGKNVLDRESAKRVLTCLASAGDGATVELRTGRDVGTLQVVVSGPEDAIADLEKGTGR